MTERFAVSIAEDETLVEPSGWFAVQLRYTYLAGDPEAVTLVEDRVILVDGTDEEAALGRAVEMAPEYEDEFETDDGRVGRDPLRGDRRHQGARRPAGRRRRGVARVHVARPRPSLDRR